MLPVFSKVLERLVYNRLSCYLETNELLSDSQYGFRRKRSTKHAVTILMDDIRTSTDNQQLTGVVFLDLRKAFDTVNHACLLNKLPIYGVNDVELQWITNYLFARSQVVNFQGTISEENYITHGVPQGSILGPLLFTLLINDIDTELSYCKIILYADDTVIYFSDKDVINIESTLNNEVNRVAKWMSDNHLTLNLKKGKTDFILYGTAKRLGKQTYNINVCINGTKVNKATKYKYLGVLLDQHLNLNEQLAATYKKVSSRLKLLKRVRPNLTSAIAEKVYHHIIQPIATYCPTAYLGCPRYQENKLQQLQDQGKNIVCCKGIKTEWKPIADIINEQILIDVHKSIQRVSPPKYHSYFKALQHGKNTRGDCNSLVIPKVKTEVGRKTFKFQGTLLFNNLPNDLKTEKSIVVFKYRLKAKGEVFIQL